jgi:hypothetical protein
MEMKSNYNNINSNSNYGSQEVGNSTVYTY